MQFRHWINWIAAIGILLHAGAAGRHNVIRFQALHAMTAAFPGAGPDTFCHAASAVNKDRQDLPGKIPGGTAKACPVCLGLVPAHVLQASGAPVLRVPRTVLAAVFVSQYARPRAAVKVSFPLNRGPPDIAQSKSC